MKLLRYGPKGEERPGLLDAAGRIRQRQRRRRLRSARRASRRCANRKRVGANARASSDESTRSSWSVSSWLVV